MSFCMLLDFIMNSQDQTEIIMSELWKIIFYQGMTYLNNKVSYLEIEQFFQLAIEANVHI